MIDDVFLHPRKDTDVYDNCGGSVENNNSFTRNNDNQGREKNNEKNEMKKKKRKNNTNDLGKIEIDH